MNDDKAILKNYFDHRPSTAETAKRSLLYFILTINGYKIVGNFGIAKVLIYESPCGGYLSVKNK